MLLATMWLCSLAQIPTSGLVQRFTFNSTLDGINGNSLAAYGSGSYVADRFSTPNSAHNVLNTSTAFNSVPLTNLPTGNADRTVSFWYKSNANATHSLFNYGNGSSTFALAYTTAPTRLVLFDGVTEYSRSMTYTGNWTHVTIVHSAGNSYVYFNGVQQGAAIAISYATTAGQTANIGYSPGGTPYTNFQLDELLVYNRALTQAEVLSIYNACNSPVNTTTAANQNICTGTTATLSVSGSNVSWYTTSSGGSPVAVTNSFNTGALSANTTYYAESAGCAIRTPVIVTVSQAAPSAPANTTSAGLLTLCAGNVTTLSVSGTDSVRWYNVSTGGTAIGTGNLFTTPTLANPFPSATGTVTYYAEAWNACGVSARTPITVTIKAAPATPVNTTAAADTNICTGSSTTLTVSSTSGTVEWSTISSTPSVVATGLSFTTPVLTNTTQYAAYSMLNGCPSNDVTITVNVSQSGAAAPTNNTAPAALLVCDGNTTSLNASSAGNTLYWYDAPTGGSLLGTGNPFTTPVINDTSIFYVQAGTGSCASTRTAITVTTRFKPTGVIQLVNDTIRATNLYSTYVLRKDTTIIASSNSTGSFAIPATQCGDYQATFTNPTNNCPNLSGSISKAYLSNDFYCEARLNFSGLVYPLTYSVGNTGIPGTPTAVDNAGPLNFPLSTNSSCSAVSGLRYVRIRSGNGCEYNVTFNAEIQGGVINTTMTSTTDTITTCSFTSNILNVSTVNLPAPTNTTAAPFLSVCSGLSTILSASGTGTLYWYDVPNGGTALGTGTSFTTQAITAPKTFYVQAGSGTCASARTAITVNVNALPPTPVNITPTANQNICSGNSTVLSVTPAGAGISTFWSLFPQGGNTFTTGASATIAASSLTTTDTFYVGNAFVSNNCNSPLIPIIVNVTQAPAAPVNTTPTANQTVCTGSSTTLTATGTGTLEWFANPTGGNALSTGGSFTTPAINTATSYFVASNGGNGCSSTRTEVQVTTAPTPPAPNNTTTTANLSRCVGNSTTLTASTNFANAPLKWYANATGGTSLATGGSYTTPVLTATDTFYVAAESATCPSPRTAIIVTVNAPPTAGISTVIPSVCPGESITLTASGGTGYAWSNSGGSNAAATFTPASATTYTVTVTNAATCTATASLNVTIRTAPVAAIAPTGAAICSGQSQALTASGGTGYAWSNSLGNGANKTVNPTQTTTYIVTVTNTNACSDTASITVNVTATPVATINGPTTICAGLSATLTASGGASYAWSNSLGSNAAITVSPTQNTAYTVTVSNGNCTATASQTVSVQSAPTATVSGNTTICNGESTTLTANGGNTYTWSNGLGSTSAITVSPATTTTYNVTVSIGANCSATTTQTITVNQPSASLFSETLCFGESTTFAGNILSAGGAYNDTLQNAAGCDSIITLNLTVLNKVEKTVAATICNGQSFDFNGTQLTQAGQYFDTLQTALGCDSFIVLNLAVVNQLTSTFSAAICQGETYDFNGQQLTSADSYTATYSSTGGCDSVVTLNLTVNALPQPVVTATANVVSTQVFDSYQWQLEGSDINGADEQQYTATQNGNYSVMVSDANGCQNTSAAVSVTGVGINNIASSIAKLYPNPAENIFTIELSGNNHTSTVSISDVNGALLLQATVEGNKATLNVSDMPAGILTVQVTNANGTSTTKLIKLK